MGSLFKSEIVLFCIPFQHNKKNRDDTISDWRFVLLYHPTTCLCATDLSKAVNTSVMYFACLFIIYTCRTSSDIFFQFVIIAFCATKLSEEVNA